MLIIYRGYWDTGSMIFPVFILLLISSDTIVMYFPRRLALVKMILIVLVLCQYFTILFLKQVANSTCCLGAYLEKI